MAGACPMPFCGPQYCSGYVRHQLGLSRTNIPKLIHVSPASSSSSKAILAYHYSTTSRFRPPAMNFFVRIGNDFFSTLIFQTLIFGTLILGLCLLTNRLKLGRACLGGGNQSNYCNTALLARSVRSF